MSNRYADYTEPTNYLLVTDEKDVLKSKHHDWVDVLIQKHFG